MVGYLVFAIIALYATRTDAVPAKQCCNAGDDPFVADTDDICKFHQCFPGAGFFEFGCATGSSMDPTITSGVLACNVILAGDCARTTPLTVEDNCGGTPAVTSECYNCEYNLDGSGGFLPCGQLDNSTQAALVGRGACSDQCYTKISSDGARLIRGCSAGWFLDRSVQCQVQSGETWKFCDTDLCNTENDPCPPGGAA